MSGEAAQSIGVLGAGTMGAGIALTALRAGRQVVLTDISQAALDQAQNYIHRHLEKKGTLADAERLSLSTEIQSLAGCQVVIEAALEELETKRQLFAQLDRICPPPAILASNTSTLSITAIGAATSTPERVAGMHFFNPAPVMQLVELARGASTAQATVDSLVMLAEALGKAPVVTRDTPGFIVNRVARPFYGEALRLLGEGVATHEELDRLFRLGGGFRMGPFELMDLIGIDVNLVAASSIYQASFFEPRFRPHWIQQQKVNQGELGRKSGVGFYRYADGVKQAAELELPQADHASGYVLLSEGSWAPNLGKLLIQAGYSLSEVHGDIPVLAIVISGADETLRADLQRYDRGLAPEIPILCQSVDRAYSELASQLAHPERLVGFDGLFAATGQVVTLTRGETTSDAAADTVSQLMRSLGKLPIWVAESPAMVLPRVVSCLANEAAFAAAEGVAEPEQIDRATVLGLNYPHGPLSWAENLGLRKVVAVLDHLRGEFGEERYRAAPWLRRRARSRPDPLERFTRW